MDTFFFQKKDLSIYHRNILIKHTQQFDICNDLGGIIMGEIKKILVPVDGSVNGCKAVDEALSIAEKCGAELDFVYVASNINKDIPSHIIFDRIWEKIPENMKAVRHVETGNVPKAILKIAESEKSDMIIMGSRGLGLFKGALIGSVSQKVVEESKVPVMVVK